MQKFTRIYYGVITVITLLLSPGSFGQCTISSSNGYNVSLSVKPVSVIKPATCPYGYNYNISFLYNVVFTGSNIPSNLYTLQGNLYCDGDANFFSLPTGGGSGTGTTVSNTWKGTTDCATATTGSLKCTVARISIEGPGIPAQTFNCASGAGTLPIDLVSFNGRIVDKNNVYLTWVTASETNNKTFTVERSENGTTWQGIKVLNGAGNSTTQRTYDFTDAGLAVGMYYYRLKQTDISGAATYSNIIGAKITGRDNGISLSYRVNQLQFTGLGNTAGWQLTLFNSASAVVMTTGSLTSSTIQLPGLATGIYFVRLINKMDNTEKVLKFFKG